MSSADQGEPPLGDLRVHPLTDHPTWKQGPASELTGRLIAATLTALTTPPGTPRVSPAAAAPAVTPCRMEGPATGARAPSGPVKIGADS